MVETKKNISIRIANSLSITNIPIYTDAKAYADDSTVEMQAIFQSETKFSFLHERKRM